MVEAHDGQMVSQPLGFFGRAPGFPDQSVHIGSEFGAGVIQAKKWIKTRFLELALPRDRAIAALHLNMHAVFIKYFHIVRVMRVLIRLDQNVWHRKALQTCEQKFSSSGSLIHTRAVLFKCSLGDDALRRHRRDDKIQDSSSATLHCQGD